MLNVPQTEPSSQSWFDQVHDIICWRIESPPLKTPFGRGMPTSLLQRLVSHRSALLRHVCVRGLVDGYEVIRIKDLKSFFFESDHMVVRRLKRGEIREYFERAGLSDWLSQKLDEIEVTYREELDRRRQEAKEEKPVHNPDETIHERKRRLAAEKALPRDGDRVNSFYSGGQKPEAAG